LAAGWTGHRCRVARGGSVGRRVARLPVPGRPDPPFFSGAVVAKKGGSANPRLRRVDRHRCPGRLGRLWWLPGRPATRAGSPGPPRWAYKSRGRRPLNPNSSFSFRPPPPPPFSPPGRFRRPSRSFLRRVGDSNLLYISSSFLIGFSGNFAGIQR
jgi:hypothetical protein